MSTAKAKKPSYLLRDLDPALWKAFQQRAKSELRAQKAVLVRLMELYVRHGLETIEHVLDDRRR